MTEGQPLDREKIEPKHHFTEPPPRFSEASLVKKLEELGIGRPSTYASILSVLQERDYVRLENETLHSRRQGSAGDGVPVQFLQRYVEFDFTATLEEELDDISAAKIDWKEVLRSSGPISTRGRGDQRPAHRRGSGRAERIPRSVAVSRRRKTASNPRACPNVAWRAWPAAGQVRRIPRLLQLPGVQVHPATRWFESDVEAQAGEGPGDGHRPGDGGDDLAEARSLRSLPATGRAGGEGAEAETCFPAEGTGAGCGRPAAGDPADLPATDRRQSSRDRQSD